jgi:hypothetical protein
MRQGHHHSAIVFVSEGEGVGCGCTGRRASQLLGLSGGASLGSKRLEKKQRWFDQGVEALSLARPGAPRVYICPLCLEAFSDAATLTFEDVPPRCMGGKPLVLTCKRCNSTSGWLLDRNIRSGEDLREINAGKRDIPMSLTMGGHKITADVTWGSHNVNLVGAKGRSNPSAYAAIFQQMDHAPVSGQIGRSFDLRFSYRHDPWLEKVGWLRVAYLYAFAALGYTYILRIGLNSVRDQICSRPKEKTLSEALLDAGPLTGRNTIMLVDAPVEGVFVCLGPRLVVLPGMRDSDNFYDRVKALAGETIELSWLELGLPTRRRFLFDRAPADGPLSLEG